MKNKILVVVAVIIFAAFINVSAQDSKGYIGISGGYSSIFGNITKGDDYLNLSQGFAKSGAPAFAIDGAYFFNKNIGAGLMFNISTYGVTGQDVLSAGYVEAFAVDEVTMTIGSYKMFNILPAFYYTLPINKLNVDFRFMIGYSGLTTPEIKVQLEDAADTPLIQEASSGGGLALGLGAGMRYAFTKHIGAAVRLDYLNAKQSVDIKYSNLNNPTDGLFRNLTTYNESIGNFNATLGLVYNF
ncbi:MAG: outer membrane beta-barrel protein [Bacteroidota bacterium]